MILLPDIFAIGFIQRRKNIVETLRLLFVGTKNIIFIAVEVIVVQIVQKQIKLLVERWLRLDGEIQKFSGFYKSLLTLILPP